MIFMTINISSMTPDSLCLISYTSQPNMVTILTSISFTIKHHQHWQTLVWLPRDKLCPQEASRTVCNTPHLRPQAASSGWKLLTNGMFTNCSQNCTSRFIPFVITLVINPGRSSSLDMLSLEWSEGNDRLQSDDGGVFGLFTGLELFDDELPSSLW